MNLHKQFSRRYIHLDSRLSQQSILILDTFILFQLKVNCLIKRGSMQLQASNVMECYQDFTKAVSIDPDNSDIYHHRGQVSNDRVLKLKIQKRVRRLDLHFIFSGQFSSVCDPKKGKWTIAFIWRENMLEYFPADIIRFGMRNVFRIFIVLDIRFKCLKDYNPWYNSVHLSYVTANLAVHIHVLQNLPVYQRTKILSLKKLRLNEIEANLTFVERNPCVFLCSVCSLLACFVYYRINFNI